MAETKYGKYIISELKPPEVEAPWSPPNLGAVSKGKGGRVLYMDSSNVPGSFYTECVWVTPRPQITIEPTDKTKKVGTESHTHDYDEVIGFFGTDLNNPYDLGAEAELWLGDEKHIINKTSLVFIPAGLKHALYFLRVDRTVFHYTTGPSKMYM
ncbi:MAG: hypothetical protein A2Z70_02685 [Chloroflexi bacterium RBG_13_48_17]|nr:MAG: hypothetical protein A2Z70_02685 [Chloroflexi bacterium RBG_13_48_17]